jgi:hypothetical protein
MFKESLEGGRVKGGMLKAHLDWADVHCPGGSFAVREQVSDATRRLLDPPILPITWYPFSALVEADRAIAALARTGERETAIELGRHSAHANLGGHYRFFNRRQPHEFFASAARMHGRFVDFGREDYGRLDVTACQLVLAESVCFSKVFCWSAVGYYEQATVLQGGRDPKVHESECVCEGGSLCRFEIGWA